jgi:hypothetical protein
LEIVGSVRLIVMSGGSVSHCGPMIDSNRSKDECDKQPERAGKIFAWKI